MSADVSTTPPSPSGSRSRHSRGWWRLALGLPLIVLPLVLGLDRVGTLRAGHPAYPLTLLGLVVVGVLLTLLAIRDLRTRRGQPSGTLRPRRRGLVTTGRVLALLLTLVLLGSATYLRPLPATTAAVGAMAGTPAVSVTSSPTSITLRPTQATPTTGLVFQPGAKVDPRAYVPLLERVAGAGYLVVVVKQPWSIGFTAVGAPGAVVTAHPEVTRWAVGGHSLGGVAAGSYAEARHPEVTGLLLWASYPLGSLADRTDLAVTSVSGTRDGLTTPADVEASRADLPATTTFVAVDGGIHGFFGDYGVQSGDGTATTDRATAQTAIVAATTALLASLAP